MLFWRAFLSSTSMQRFATPLIVGGYWRAYTEILSETNGYIRGNYSDNYGGCRVCHGDAWVTSIKSWPHWISREALIIIGEVRLILKNAWKIAKYVICLLQGERLTWNNKQEGDANIWKRLDKVVANPSWVNHFLNFEVVHLLFGGSDRRLMEILLDKGVVTRVTRQGLSGSSLGG